MAVPLLEGALIYWIHRFLFIAADDSEYIKKLEDENAKLKRSTAIGLADSYFWNYAYKVSEIVKEYRDND